MHKYIERIINVEGEGNCGFQAISHLLFKGEDDYQFVHRHLIQEMKTHRESYTKLYGNKPNYDTILNALVPCLTGPTPFEKWMHFPEMGHLIASAYNRVFIILTRYDFSETFFPLRSKPPQNPLERIMCIKQHFVHVYLKSGCLIPKTSLKWNVHFTQNAETWLDHLLERMDEFTKLSYIEREENKERSKNELPTNLDSDICFDTFSL